MNVQVLIGPDERCEAIETYRDWLTPAQQDQIRNAPEGALVGLLRDNKETFVFVDKE